jgi:glutathione S-transferase
MADLSAFPITQRWPAAHPDRIQLYSVPTPNGVKVSIMLEETGLAYEPHAVNIGQNETWTPEFLSLNPNGKIPAIIDPDGPGGAPFALFESGAILLYLAEKTGKLLPADPCAATRPSNGCSSRWRRWGRCSASSATSTNSPAGRSRTSGPWSAIAPSRSACSAC